jgi:hypothetical protein
MRLFSFVQLLIVALWLGSGAAIMLIGAPAAFAAAGDRTTAGAVVGVMLRRWHYLSLFLPAALLIFEWRHGFQHSSRVLLLAAAIVLGAAQVAVDAKLHQLRADSLTPISELAPTDPLRRTFGRLHAASSLFMLLQVIAAGAVVWTFSGAPEPPAALQEKVRELEL